MRSLTILMVVTCVMASTTAQAALVESGCVSVVGVVNGGSGAVILALSPAISGCTPNTTPGVEFGVGVNGVTATNLNSFLASGLTAFTTGQKVMVLYDNSTSNCYGMEIANGGFHGEC